MMKTNLLSAVVTLGLALPGSAVLAQDTATEEELLIIPAETPEQPAEETTTEEPAAEPTVEPAPEETPAEAEPAPAEEATEAPADEAAAEEEATPADEPAAEVTTEEAPAEDATEEEAPAEEEAAEDGQSTAEENADAEVIVEDDVAGQASGDDPEVGVMEEEDHGDAEADHATDEDHGDDSHATPHIENIDFSFDGPFGGYDVNQLQRGLQIYTEVCAACHGLEYVAMRTLADESGPNMPEDQVIEYAKGYDVYDAELDDTRPGTPVDHFPGSNLENAPDLSLMAKSRAGFHGPYGTGISQFVNGMGGAEYIASLMDGYEEEPACAAEMETPMEGAYNVAFANGGFPDACKDEHGHHTVPGSWIAMPQPLYGDDVEFDDGHEATLESESQDVAAFLMWAAEPKMTARKQAGLTGVIFLSLLSVLLYLTNKRIWAPHKNKLKD